MEVIAEVVRVLAGVYGVPRPEIASMLAGLVPRMACARADVAIEALEEYGRSSLDFVDCVLLATARLGKADVLAFDKKLARAIAQH